MVLFITLLIEGILMLLRKVREINNVIPNAIECLLISNTELNLFVEMKIPQNTVLKLSRRSKTQQE